MEVPFPRGAIEVPPWWGTPSPEVGSRYPLDGAPLTPGWARGTRGSLDPTPGSLRGTQGSLRDPGCLRGLRRRQHLDHRVVSAPRPQQPVVAVAGEHDLARARERRAVRRDHLVVVPRPDHRGRHRLLALGEPADPRTLG